MLQVVFLFQMNHWSVVLFLGIVVITFGWLQQQTHPKGMTEMVKKCSTDQSFIQKRDTTNKIGALGAYLKENWIITCLLLLKSLHVKIFGTLLCHVSCHMSIYRLSDTISKLFSK